MAHELTQHQLTARERLRKLLEGKQAEFYRGQLVSLKGLKGYVASCRNARVIFPSEKDAISVWLDCWGWTIDGKAAPLSYMWETDTHPCSRGGRTKAARAAAV